MKQDPFELLGLPARFGLSTAEIEERFRALSRALHPDKFAKSGSSERRIALERAVTVNEAYRSLRGETGRAEQLLIRAGETLSERESTMPGAFLMEMMELREELAAARTRKDRGAIQSLAGNVHTRRTKLLDELGKAFDVRADFATARVLVAELKYLDRFLEEVNVLEEELDVLGSSAG